MELLYEGGRKLLHTSCNQKSLNKGSMVLRSHMQTEYNNMTTTSLVDLLAEQTERFTHLISENRHTPEYEELKTNIRMIQSVIEARKETTNPPAPNRV
jgi:hypothetical protein